MLSNKTIITVIVFLTSLFVTVTGPRKIYFIGNDSLTELNGNIKQVISARVDWLNNPNPGQDFDTIKFDEKGNVTKIIHGFHGSIFRDYYRTIYSTDNKKLETIGYVKPNDAVSYDPPDPLLSKMSKSADTSWKDILTYKYDENGLITQYVLKLNKNQTDSTAFKYNSHGDLSEADYYFNPTILDRVIKYTYDYKDNLIEEDLFRGNTIWLKTKFKYTAFDTHNNWTDMVTHSEIFIKGLGVPDNTMHREITYY